MKDIIKELNDHITELMGGKIITIGCERYVMSFNGIIFKFTDNILNKEPYAVYNYENNKIEVI